MKTFAPMDALVAGRKAAVATGEAVRSLRVTDPEQLVIAKINEAEGNFRQPLEEVFPYRIQPRDFAIYQKGSSTVALNKLDYSPGDHSAIVDLSIASEGQPRLAACLTEAAILQRLDRLEMRVNKTMVSEFMLACDLETATKACTEFLQIHGLGLKERSTAFKQGSLAGKTGHGLGKYLGKVFEIEKQHANKRKTSLELETPPHRPKPTLDQKLTLDQKPKEEKRTALNAIKQGRVTKPNPNIFGKRTGKEVRANEKYAAQVREERSQRQG